MRLSCGRGPLVGMCVVAALLGRVTPASALDRLCDPANENCRTILINYIRAETVGIDVGFWFMEDSRYTTELINRFNAGVPVRVLVDPRANASTPLNAQRLSELQAAGIPMRKRTASGILHYKMMLFAGQNIVEFSGANYSADAWVFTGTSPYQNYVDESIYFTDDASIVHSFMTKYDDLWTNTTAYANYANVPATLTREYPTFAKDSHLNFPPAESYANRALGRYNAETQKIDVIMFRITDQRHTNAMISLHQNGIPIRLITEPDEYRDPARLWDSWNVDRLYAAGIPIKMRAHAGLNHQKLVLLYSQTMAIFGSSNWTSPSDQSQEEHNYFVNDKPAMFQWLVDQFERKWNNATGVAETAAFAPLPPDTATTPNPANAAAGVSTTVTLKWYGGPWAHNYDIYFGTSPSPPLVAADQNLGPSQTTTQMQSYAVPTTLAPGTTYYWKIVSKTMANLTRTSPVWSFTTDGTAPPSGGTLPSPWSHQDIGAVGVAGDATFDAATSTFTVKGAGADVWGTADALHFAYRSLSGDGSIVARVTSVSSQAPWVKAGVMIRSGADPGAAQGFMLVSFSKGLAFQRRTAAGGTSTSTAGAAASAPYWVRLDRTGNTVSAYQSANGSTWTLVASDTIALGTTALVGLGVSSHTTSAVAIATFDNVTVTGGAPPPPPPPTLPAGWAHQDVGAVGVAGDASYDAATGTFTVKGAGADVWGTADAFQYAYRSLSGDGSIVARVVSVTSQAAWVKAGVMMRSSTSASSAHGFMLVSFSKGLAFQRRTATGGISTSTAGAMAGAPYWVRLDRAGTSVSAYQSADGVTWSLVSTDSIPMGATIWVGLGVSSHTTSAAATAKFDHVTVTGGS